MVRAALSVALMYLSLVAVHFSPTGDAFFFTVAASVLMAVLLLCGLLWAVLAYLALGLIAVTTLGPLLSGPFLLAYGLWVFIKMGIEWLCFTKAWPLWKDYFLKTVAAVGFALIARYVLAEWVLGRAFNPLRERLGILSGLWPLALVILILIYDHVLTMAKRLMTRELFPYLH